MTTPQRRTLADRNSAAIRLPQSAAPTNSTDTVKVSAYLSNEQYNLMRSAFLADWQDGGHHDRFADWITAAIENHATLTPTKRQPLDRGTPTGSPRSFTIPRESQELMRDAMSDDSTQGQWLTASQWIANALMAAVKITATRRAETGMPTPPPKLPQRLH